MINSIDSRISFNDRLDAAAVRIGFRRGKCTVPPGLYRLNKPDATSPVFISANYKLSFDILRRSLDGTACWLLVLDTRGINVWCAAGKGTFGTDEIITRINETRLAEVVNHKNIIVPQLGAPGVQAHIVRRKTGFRVIYGPVEAPDIHEFLTNNMKKTDAMRTKTFGIRDRLVLTPIELVHSWKLFLPVAAAILIFTILTRGLHNLTFGETLLPAILAVLSGGLLTPALLPWIPSRPFALKGALTGLVISLLWFLGIHPPIESALFCGGLMISSSSFIAMNFTGASTFTSLSGVKKEMRFAVPLQIFFTVAITLAAVLIAVFSGGRQ